MHVRTCQAWQTTSSISTTRTVALLYNAYMDEHACAAKLSYVMKQKMRVKDEYSGAKVAHCRRYGMVWHGMVWYSKILWRVADGLGHRWHTVGAVEDVSEAESLGYNAAVLARACASTTAS